MLYAVIWDIAFIHSQRNPCFKAGGPSFTAFGWWWRTTSCAFIISVWCTKSVLYAAGSIVYVAMGLYEPKDCPHLFGSILDAYTIENVGGISLLLFFAFAAPLYKIGPSHLGQMFRRIFTSHSKNFARALHLPAGHDHDVLHFIFHFISGLMHAAPDYILHQNFSEGTSIQFFVLQAVAIIFEDAVVVNTSRLR